jgi:predicted nucleic acid-binding protein
VLDTSVVIKWYRQGEVLAKQALALRAAYLEGRSAISAPSLLIYELANMLRYKSDLSTAQVQAAVQGLFAMSLNILLPDSSLMRQAVELARAYEITAYDAVFVALAQTLPATLVTADDRLAACLSGLPWVHALSEVTL